MKKIVTKIIVLGLILILAGCNVDKTKTSNSYDGIQLTKNAEIVAENRMENIIKKGAEKLSRFYGDIYEYQQDPIVEELNGLYDDYIVQLVNSRLEEKLVVDNNVLFYSDSIKDYKEKKLTFEEIINNPGTHIKRASIQLHIFRTKPKLTKTWFKTSLKEIYAPLEHLWSVYRIEEVDNINVLWSIYDEEILNQISLEDLDQEDNKILYMDTYKSCLGRFVLDENGFDSYKDGILSNQVDLDYLADKTEKKYNEPFIGIINAGKKGKSYAAPTRDASLYFELNGTEKDKYEPYEGSQDRYLALLMYLHVQSEIEKILDKYEMSEIVLPILVTKDARPDINLLELEIDYIQEWPEFLEEKFPGRFQVTLNILSKRKECDEKTLYTVAKEIQYILGPKYYDNYRDMNIMVYFYSDITNEGKKMTQEIYNKSVKIDNRKFEETRSLATIFDSLYINYSYEDWFKYLSKNFEREEGHIVITEILDESSPNTFLDKYKRDEL